MKQIKKNEIKEGNNLAITIRNNQIYLGWDKNTNAINELLSFVNPICNDNEIITLITQEEIDELKDKPDGKYLIALSDGMGSRTRSKKK